MHNINLLTPEQLAAFGLSEPQIGLVNAARPIDSIVDLLFIPELDAEDLIPRLVASMVLAGTGDLVLLPPSEIEPSDPCDPEGDDLDYGTDESVFLIGDDDGGEGGAKPVAPPKVLASGSGWSITSKAKDAISPIADCTTTKTFEIKATKGGRDGDYDHDYNEHRAPAEKQATDGVKLRIGSAVGYIVAMCSCTGANCKKQSIEIDRTAVTFSYSIRKRGMKNNGIRYRGWEARADQGATVKITCKA